MTWQAVLARADRRAADREFPDNPEMWVSDETIYKAIFVQGKGLLKQEVARGCARVGRCGVPRRH